MEEREGPYGITGVVGAAVFGVGVLIILLSTTLPCASGHLGVFHLQGGNLVLRWSFAMKVLSEFAVIAKTWNLNFWFPGQMSIWAEGKT